jgi:hypothetical protein
MLVTAVVFESFAFTTGYVWAAASFGAKYVTGLWRISRFCAIVLGIPAALICAYVWVWFCIVVGVALLLMCGFSFD